jgi:hypothetical protein
VTEPDALRLAARESDRRYRERNLEACRERGREKCRREYALAPDKSKVRSFKSLYRLDKRQAQVAVVNAEGGMCDSCGKITRLQVDHDHETGRARGMICRACNLIAGHAHDSEKQLAAVAAYLRRTR